MNKTNVDTIALPKPATARTAAVAAAAPVDKKQFVGVATKPTVAFHSVPSKASISAPADVAAPKVPVESHSSVTFYCEPTHVNEKDYFDSALQRVVAPFELGMDGPLRAVWEDPDVGAQIMAGQVNAAIKSVHLAVTNVDSTGVEAEITGLGDPDFKVMLPPTDFKLDGAMPTATKELYRSDFDTNERSGQLFAAFGHMMTAEELAKTHSPVPYKGHIDVQLDTPIANAYLSAPDTDKNDVALHASGLAISIPEARFAAVKDEVLACFATKFRILALAKVGVTLKSATGHKSLGSATPLTRGTFKAALGALTPVAAMASHTAVLGITLKVDIVAYTA